MRVLVEPGSHHVLNLGDAAMLQVCAARIRELAPGVTLDVVTTAPDRLARHCPEATPLPAEGQYRWQEHGVSDPSVRAAGIRRGLVRGLRASRGRLGRRAARMAVRAEARARGLLHPEAGAFVDALTGAGAFVMSGRGGLTDAFLEDSLETLDLLELAGRLGIPVALMSQGIGPIRHPALRARAAAVLPRVDLVAVRERRAAPALLAELGVPTERVHLTGDDAVEPAYCARPDRLGGGIGVNLRASDYADVGADDLGPVRDGLAAAAERLGAPLVPVPVSLYPGEADAETIARLTGAERPVETVGEAIGRAGQCRVVVSGGYHAALFALAQGVPVVGLVRSPYAADKLHGLADLFGPSCRVLGLDEPDLAGRLARAVEDAWAAADGHRPELLAAAERQVEWSRAAYRRLGDLVR